MSKETDEIDYSPYCPICSSCGEDGCCPATMCEHHSDGYYCDRNLAELRFGYIMYHQLMKLIDGDPKYTDKVSELWNEIYDNIFNDEPKNK